MRVVFLDRDGVINEYPGDTNYVNNWSEFAFIPGSIEGIKKLNACGFKLCVISNQAGVAKGLYTQADLDRIDKGMLEEFKKQGAQIEGIYYCTHSPSDNCDCRKPKIGLLKQAVSDLGIIPQMSFFVGDSFRDMEAARCFGAKSILVLSGKKKKSRRSQWEFDPDYIFDNLRAAADYLCAHYG